MLTAHRHILLHTKSCAEIAKFIIVTAETGTLLELLLFTPRIIAYALYSTRTHLKNILYQVQKVGSPTLTVCVPTVYCIVFTGEAEKMWGMLINIILSKYICLTGQHSHGHSSCFGLV